MVTQVAKQYREQIAVALLAVAVTYLGAGLGMLFKSYDNAALDFSDKSALDGYLFTHPVLVASIVLAVILVTSWGEPSHHARTIVLAAVGIGAVALVFAVIAWIAGFSSDDRRLFAFAGVFGAGKVVGAFVGLAQIALLVLALFFAGIALQALPRPVRAATQWGSPYGQPGWGSNQDWQQAGQWQGSQYPGQPPWAAPPQAQWRGEPQPWPQQPPGWGEPDHPGWQQPGAGWQQPPGYETPPTEAYEQPPGEQQPASNADLYWRSAEHEDSRSEAADSSGPSHLADVPTDSEPDPAGADEPTASTSTVGSWSGAAGPSASEVATESPDPDEDAGPSASDASDADDGHDDSGWWRPSSSS